MKPKKLSTKKQVKPIGASNSLDSNTHCIEMVYSEKQGYKITMAMLDKLMACAKKIDRKPHLVIGIKKDDKTNYVLHCTLTEENRH